jgi:hypothetical protein
MRVIDALRLSYDILDYRKTFLKIIIDWNEVGKVALFFVKYSKGNAVWFVYNSSMEIFISSF